MTDNPETPRIEVTIAAPVERVWSALREPEQVRRWHGWHFDGLDDEVRLIYVDNVTVDAEQHVLTVGDGDRFSLHPAEGGTVVRITRAPKGTDPEWAAYYDDVTEGWITFLHQLRFGLERHDLAERRTVLLEGAGVEPAEALGLSEAAALPVGARYRATLATGDEFAGEVYAHTANQHLFTVDTLGDGLLVLARQPVNPHRPNGGALILLTTYDVPDPDATALADRWQTWWRTHTKPATP